MQQAYSAFAAVYDRLMSDVDYGAWANYIAGLLPAPTGLSIFECACGTGEIGIRLFGMGHRVTASDISEPMLARAMEKARIRSADMHFVRQDMRHIAVHRPVDAVVCACDGVNYLTDLGAAGEFFRSAHAALKPGGALLFDISSAYKLKHILAGHTFGEEDDEIAYLWRNAYDESDGCVQMSLTCFVRRGALYERFDEIHMQRAHTREELTRALKEAGFRDVAVYEAFTRSAPKENTERLQFAAYK